MLLARFCPCCWRRSRAVPNRRANKDHFERIGALAAYAEYGKGQKAMVVLPLSEVETNRVWVAWMRGSSDVTKWNDVAGP